MKLRNLFSSKRIVASIVVLILGACTKNLDLSSEPIPNNFITENVVIVVIDGPRYTETWGNSNRALIPKLANNLAPNGIINQQFYNLGNTHTIPGHTAIISGVYEDLDNNGRQYPTYPSFLQHWLATTKSNPRQAWIIGSKEKLKVLGNCSSINWRGSYLPSVDAQDRDDPVTFNVVKTIINEHHPKLLFINLKGPDSGGHAKDWEAYKHGIKETDSLLNEIYKIIETDSVYAGKTTLIMTNDHGRHLDGMVNGFVSHGDKCLGCTHINFYAYGPDFHKGVITNKQREQTDIAPTVAHLLGIKMNQTSGHIMNELFK